MEFEWDAIKNLENQKKHFVSFEEAEKAFIDENRIILHDPAHSGHEDRWFCTGKVEGKIVTVRYTLRENKIRIIGAGYWRKGRKRYEER